MTSATVGAEYMHDASVAFLDISCAQLDVAEARLLEIQNRTRRFEPADLAVLAPCLDWRHEADHYRALSTQPLGLLLWRLAQCIAVDVMYVARAMHRVRFMAAGPFGKRARAFAAAQWLGAAAPSEPMAAAVALDLGVLLDFRRMLMNGRGVTVGEFLEVANKALALLAIRSELPSYDAWTGHRCPIAVWTSSLPAHAPLVADDAFTFLEIVEARARGRERYTLSRLGATRPILETWHERRIFGVYAAFEPLLDALGEAFYLPTIADLALSGRLDLICGREGDTFLIEDELPSFRMPRLVEAARDMIWDPSTLGVSMEQCLARAGLAPARDMYQQLAELPAPYVGAGANFGGDRKTVVGGAPAAPEVAAFTSTAAYFEATQDRFRNAFRMRADDPGQFAVVAASFRPLLSYVRDWCDARPTDETDVVVLAQTHGNFLDRALTDHLLGRRDIAFLVEVDRAFWAALGESLPTLTLKLVFCLRERVRLMQSMGVADDIVQALGGAHLLGDEEDEKRRVAHLLELEERPNIVDDAPAAPRASSVGGWFARLFGRTNKSVNREDLP